MGVHAGHGQIHGAETESLSIPIDRVFCPCCEEDLDAVIGRFPHVVDARVDADSMVAHVTVHRGMTSAEELRERIEACNYMNPVPLPQAQVSAHEHVHEAAAKTAAHGGHEAMGHDMSDPRMAAAMEADMKRRFLTAFALAIPVVALSPLGTLVLGREIPVPIERNWALFVFATPVALWASSVFHFGAWRSIRSGVLNMSVLVSLGILVSYLFSLALTLTVGGETFYEAAVMLAVFLLFGHWMEMRARRGPRSAAPAPSTIARSRRGARCARAPCPRRPWSRDSGQTLSG